MLLFAALMLLSAKLGHIYPEAFRRGQASQPCVQLLDVWPCFDLQSLYVLLQVAARAFMRSKFAVLAHAQPCMPSHQMPS